MSSGAGEVALWLKQRCQSTVSSAIQPVVDTIRGGMRAKIRYVAHIPRYQVAAFVAVWVLVSEARGSFKWLMNISNQMNELDKIVRADVVRRAGGCYRARAG